jgi:translation initiation factor IF-1
MARADLVPLEGKVVSVHRGGLFEIECTGGHTVLAKLAGKARRYRIRVVLGDYVTVRVSPYDPSRGIIVYRHRNKPRPKRNDYIDTSANR